MKITVFGAGYVGLVCAACFADMGNEVLCIDSDEARIGAILSGRSPIHEPGLDAIVRRNVRAGRLHLASGNGSHAAGRDAVFIAVGTPPDDAGAADLSQVRGVAHLVGAQIDRYTVVVNKSTVPVGTAEEVQRIVASGLRARGVETPFDVVANPEFLKEGSAVHDFLRPDRIVVGAASARAVELMRDLYAPISRQRDKFIVMDARSAELTKYTANAMLALRISFMNEMAALAGRLGADIEHVRLGVGADPRIGPQFIYPGIGFGGSCFPKDLRALEHMAHHSGLQPRLLPAVREVNDEQKRLLSGQISRHFGGRLEGRTVAVWGLAFKPGTDDVREAPGCELVTQLLTAGASVRAYDPMAMPNARAALAARLDTAALARLTLVEHADVALEGADVLALATEWKEFSSPDFGAMAQKLRARAVFDGRNQYRPQSVMRHGIAYWGVGRGSPALPLHAQDDAPPAEAEVDEGGQYWRGQA